MSTFSRLTRFDQDKLAEIYFSGSIDYTIGEFNLFSVNTEDDDPNKSLISIPIETKVYDVDKINELYPIEFEEFIDEEEEFVASVVGSDEDAQQLVESLQSQLDNAQSQLLDKMDTDQLNSAQKEIIIELRKRLGEDVGSDGFSDEFPYNAIGFPDDE